MVAASAFFAALCRGLIEAERRHCLFVARAGSFSAALCRGLIEARSTRRTWRRVWWRFPRLYAAASLKHRTSTTLNHAGGCFPRLYAAASLKREEPARHRRPPLPVFRGFMPRPH